MMVATAFPTAAAPQATKGQTANAASATGEPEATDFASALLQLLGSSGSEDTSANPLTGSANPLVNPLANPLASAILQTLDDETGESPTPVALPVMLPLDALAARLLAPGQGEAAADPLAAMINNAANSGAAGAGPLAGLTTEDIARALEALLRKAGAEDSKAVDPSTQLLQSAPLAQQAPDTQALQRNPATEGSLPRQIQSQVGTPAWSDELGARLQLMAEKGQHAASLRLSPEHLGPLEVQISVSDDQATVWFGAQNADTRAALEQALPRLRELFAAQGLSLTQSGVSHESPRDTGHPVPTRGSAGMTGDSTEAEAPLIATVVRRGLVDTWA